MTTVLTCNPSQPVAENALAAIKARQQLVWGAGDFAVIGTTLQIVGEQLCESLDLRSTERVLDVAAGNGNATLAAARRFAAVTSTDYVPALLDKAGLRSPAQWGMSTRLAELFGSARALSHETRTFTFRYQSARHWIRDVPRVLRPGAHGLCVARPAAASQARGRPVRVLAPSAVTLTGPFRGVSSANDPAQLHHDTGAARRRLD